MFGAAGYPGTNTSNEYTGEIPALDYKTLTSS
jgi:hypothetical protein